MEDNYGETFSPTSFLSTTAGETYAPGFMNDPWHGNRIQRSLVHEIMQIGPTGHDTEQGSVSGLPQANMVETEATAAVPGRPGQKRKREINSAERSKNFRDKKKKEEYHMMGEMQRLQEENKRLRKENKKLKKNQDESNRKLNVQLRKIRRSKKDLEGQKIQTNSRSKTKSLNISYLQEENTRLKALMQQGNAGTNAKKWVKIPLGDRILKIKGNVLFLKMV